MNSRWHYFAWTLLAVVGLGVVLLWTSLPAQRTYRGKPISYWIDQLQQPGTMRQAGDTIREIGPPAAPWRRILIGVAIGGLVLAAFG